MVYLNYPIKLEAAKEGGFVVSFPDVPEAFTQGEDKAEALLRASDALATALEFYTDAGEDLPRPGKPKKGQLTVSPRAQAAIKLSIYQAMREQHVRKADLARRLGWHMPQVDRLLDLHHASRLEHVEAALGALDRQLSVSVEKRV
jgi:antitoxin HicB